MSTCPICGNVSAGKRISFSGYEIFDLCADCTSYSACLINPNIDVSVKENAISWADKVIEENRNKKYLADCIRSWRQIAEEFIMHHKASVFTASSGSDEAIDGFSKESFSKAKLEENEKDIFSSSAVKGALKTETKEEKEVKEVKAEPSAASISPALREEISLISLLSQIVVTLDSINRKMDKIEKEIEELKKR